MEIVHLSWNLFWNPCWHIDMESSAKPGVSDLESILNFLDSIFTTANFFHVGEQVYKKILCVKAWTRCISALVHSNGNTGIVINFELHDIQIEATGKKSSNTLIDLIRFAPRSSAKPLSGKNNAKKSSTRSRQCILPDVRRMADARGPTTADRCRKLLDHDRCCDRNCIPR